MEYFILARRIALHGSLWIAECENDVCCIVVHTKSQYIVIRTVKYFRNICSSICMYMSVNSNRRSSIYVNRNKFMETKFQILFINFCCLFFRKQLWRELFFLFYFVFVHPSIQFSDRFVINNYRMFFACPFRIDAKLEQHTRNTKKFWLHLELFKFYQKSYYTVYSESDMNFIALSFVQDQ